MSATVYRFLPWSRRGLAAAVPGGALDAAPLPQRAMVHVDMTVGTGPSQATSAMLHGPGDVIGLDPSVIVRLTPQTDATNVEPNYLVAIDFDQPELPWLFTPAGAPASGHLRPWLVLLVVQERPGVTVTVPRGAPLPQLRIESGAAGDLPDLADSWAWAHAQLLDSDSGAATPEAVGAGLRDHPDRNVSRLISPRRLTPGQNWLACLVPAFDAGVARGLGRAPAAGPALGNAWGTQDSVTLPLYFHWRFSTGPAGDFESLARRIKPYKASSDIGRVKMHVGAASPPIALPDGDPARFLDMDGALRAPILQDGTLDEVPDRLREGLAGIARTLADAADGVIDGLTLSDEGKQPVGPPVYGAFIRRQHVVEDADPVWFRELNLDPRPRVGAGLGAEVLRANQEELVHAAWQQVGSVLDAEATLSRARLALEAARRLHERHLRPQPPDRLALLTAPLAARTRFGQVTVQAAIRPTSLPDLALDGAMRRMTASTGRVMVRVAKRLGVARSLGFRPAIVERLATGMAGVDPTTFDRIAISGGIAEQPTDLGDGRFDLTPLGIPLTVTAAEASRVLASSTAIAAGPMPEGDDRLLSRPDLRSVGMVTRVHLEAARLTAQRAQPAGEGGNSRSSGGTDVVLSGILSSARARPGVAGFLLDPNVPAAASPTVHALELGAGGRLNVVPADGGTAVLGARINAGVLASSPIGNVLDSLPSGTITSPTIGARTTIEIRPGTGSVRLETGRFGTGIGVVVNRGRVGGATEGPSVGAGRAPASNTITVGPLVTDSAVIARFETAVRALSETTSITEVQPAKELVSFDLRTAATLLLARCDPLVSHAARRDSLVRLAGVPAGRLASGAVALPGWRVAPLVDRVLAYPVLDLPAYLLLANYDRTRFCPGIDEVPTDSLTLLETNPRFIAGFMAGLNHEMNRELLWRRYPTDQRGTPLRRFWDRLDGNRDIKAMHEWLAGTLAEQTTDPKGNLVLLLRGQLLRRYPNTIVVAITAKGLREPSEDPADVLLPIFAGRFDPDVTFYGFPLEREQVLADPGWFFALMEPPTEPRFGLDEAPDEARGAKPSEWADVAWSDLPTIQPGGHLTSAGLAALGLPGPVLQADGVAAAIFQRPFELLVLGKHLLAGD